MMDIIISDVDKQFISTYIFDNLQRIVIASVVDRYGEGKPKEEMQQLIKIFCK